MKGYKGLESVRPAGDLRLEVVFKGGRVATVDLEPWIDGVGMLQLLRDPDLFARARVHEWGWHVEWVPDEIDVAGDQLWRMAGEQAGEIMPTAEFRAWRARHRLSLTDAARVLGLSRRLVAYYDGGQRPVPRTILLACGGYDALAADEARRAA